MKKLCVVRDGVLLNFGPWEHKLVVKDVAYRNVEREVKRLVDGVLTDQIEIEAEPYEVERIIDNPFPEGATEAEFDVQWTADGRLVLASDYAARRQADYPSLGDQLDALFKAGVFPPEMAARIQAVKDQHPKR